MGAASNEELFTRDQLEEIIRRRQSDQERLIERSAERAVERIRPEFNTVNGTIADLAEQVRKTNGTVSKHAELIGDLGIEDLSQEERETLPEVLREDVQARRNRRVHDRRERRRTVLLQLAATVIGTITGTAIATTAVLSYVATHHP